jgi:hypothetical protein
MDGREGGRKNLFTEWLSSIQKYISPQRLLANNFQSFFRNSHIIEYFFVNEHTVLAVVIQLPLVLQYLLSKLFDLFYSQKRFLNNGNWEGPY